MLRQLRQEAPRAVCDVRSACSASNVMAPRNRTQSQAPKAWRRATGRRSLPRDVPSRIIHSGDLSQEMYGPEKVPSGSLRMKIGRWVFERLKHNRAEVPLGALHGNGGGSGPEFPTLCLKLLATSATSSIHRNAGTPSRLLDMPQVKSKTL